MTFTSLPAYSGDGAAGHVPLLDTEARLIQQAYTSGNLARWIVDVDTDATLRFRTVNPAYESLTGLTRGYMAGRRVGDLAPRLPIAQVEAIQANYRACIAAEHAIKYEEQLSIDGVSSWWLTTLTPILEAGRVVRIVGASVNIDEQKNAQHTLDAANQDMKLFLHSFSHDFQSPLRAISGFGGILQRKHGSAMSDDAARLVSMMVTAADHATTLLSDLMAFTQASERDLEPRLVDLHHVAERVTGLTLRVERDEAEAQIHLGDLPTILADPSMMALLLQNLIGNALKYRRQVPTVVEVRAIEQRDAWRIEVEDNGMGINEAGCARVFEAFQRLHSDRDIQGTGLGLAICSRIVERHGGTMDVHSVPGHGSTFAFTLPKADMGAA